MPKKLNLDLEKKVVALYNKRYNFSAIARELNLHRHTVKKILEQRGLLAINNDPDLIKLNDEVEKFRKFSARKNAYMKQQSKLIRYKSDLLDIDEDDNRLEIKLNISKNEDNNLLEDKNKLLITLLREMERTVPRTFRNICLNKDLDYNEILDVMWGSRKLHGDAIILLKHLLNIHEERFKQYCEELGLNIKDIINYLNDISIKDILDIISRKND